MKLYILPLLACMAALPATGAEPQNGTGETDGYRLVWQDLFDSGELNTNRWNIEVNGDGGGNNELQYYTNRDANVRVGDDGRGNGCLILTAVREEYENHHFTSGRVNSFDKFTFTHGKIEASLKIPVTANGLWPAFWMMGNDIGQVGWPKCSETDIMEMGHGSGISRGVSDKLFNGALHWGTAWNHTGDIARDKINRYSLQDGEFHLFTVIWDDTHIAMYLDLDKNPDARPYLEAELTDMTEDNDRAIGKYFHKPNGILFNLAVGGNFPGIWNDAEITAVGPEQGDAASYYINYVKVYQKGDDSETMFALVDGDPQPEDTIESIGREDLTEAEEIYYDLQGRRVENPANGFFIKKKGTLTSKVIL